MRAILLVAVLALAASACGKSEREASPQKPRPVQPRKARAAQPRPPPMPEVVPPARPEVAAPPTDTDSADSLPVEPIAPAGPSGKALLCDGQTDRAGNLPGVRLPVEGLFDNQQAITVELWFRPDTLAERKTPPEFCCPRTEPGTGAPTRIPTGAYRFATGETSACRTSMYGDAPTALVAMSPVRQLAGRHSRRGAGTTSRPLTSVTRRDIWQPRHFSTARGSASALAPRRTRPAWRRWKSRFARE